jgi:hypothetical protein
VQGPKGVQGQQGQPGAQGVPGPIGPKGDPGLSGYQLVSSTVAANTFDKTDNVVCPGGTKVIGGGMSSDGAYSGVVVQSFPNTDHSWFGRAHSLTPGLSFGVTVYAICAAVD